MEINFLGQYKTYLADVREKAYMNSVFEKFNKQLLCGEKLLGVAWKESVEGKLKDFLDTSVTIPNDLFNKNGHLSHDFLTDLTEDAKKNYKWKNMGLKWIFKKSHFNNHSEGIANSFKVPLSCFLDVPVSVYIARKYELDDDTNEYSAISDSYPHEFGDDFILVVTPAIVGVFGFKYPSTVYDGSFFAVSKLREINDFLFSDFDSDQ